MGSRAAFGDLKPEDLDRKRNGISLAEGIRRIEEIRRACPILASRPDGFTATLSCILSKVGISTGPAFRSALSRYRQH